MDRPFVVGTGAATPTNDGKGTTTDAGIWHVTVTMAGPAVEPAMIRAALERLAQERPFLLDARYAPDHAELVYWEEARDVDDAAAMALRLWGEHRVSADLPPWTVAGLEVVDRATYRRRALGAPSPSLVSAGKVRPF